MCTRGPVTGLQSEVLVLRTWWTVKPPAVFDGEFHLDYSSPGEVLLYITVIQ